VRESYRSGSKGYIFARDREEARLIIDNFFPKLSGGYSAEFVEIGDAAKLATYNESIRKATEEKLASLKRQIKDITVSIENLQNHSAMLSILESHQMLSDSDSDITMS
jgi:hypothetical protein